MNRGMLWFDNNPKTNLASKIKQAAEYYRQKYGAAPNLCLVHPSMLADKTRRRKGSPSAPTAPFCPAICGLDLLKRSDRHSLLPLLQQHPAVFCGVSV